MSQSPDGQSPASPVESVDSSEQSLDEQLVQLAQAKLDGRIDEVTYERLIGLIRELQPTHNWDLAELVQYPRRPVKSRVDFSVLEKTFIFACILFLAFMLLGIISNATLSVPRVNSARITASSYDLANLRTALDAFEIDNGRYPTPAEGLHALLSPPHGLMASWRGPYVRSIPLDAWGHPYIYSVAGKKHANGFDLLSTGPDGKPGTADDISN
jgi:general secretion pathway protein G